MFKFCSWLGDKVELKGWKNYRAGLDVSKGNTGTHSIYTKWEGYEIMYHVSHLLPFSTVEKQQV